MTSQGHDKPALETTYRTHIAQLIECYSGAITDAGYDTLVIHAGTSRSQCPFDDQYWPLRPTPAFAHWLPLVEAGCALVIQPGAAPTLHRPIVSDYWEGQPKPESDHFWSAFEVVNSRTSKELASGLPAGERIAYIGGDVEALAVLGAGPGAINPQQLLATLDTTRTLKTDYERLCVAEANRRAARGHVELMDAFHAGATSELELHLAYLRATEQDANDTPYTNIVAIDEHAAILHHVNYTRRAANGGAHSLLVDAGATYLGYASDITRTSVRGDGEDAALFGQLIAQLETLQRAVCEHISIGMEYEDLHDHAHELLADVLRELGVSSASAAELVDSGATRTFLPHGLGHSLGIQVHDVGTRIREPKPRNPHLRNTSTIAAGQLFTIEPGCYFIKALLDELRSTPVAGSIDWAVVDRLARFGGVRIEDNIAVLTDGSENLTRDNWPDTP